MSWLRRKDNSPGEQDHDPRIDLARQALRKPDPAAENARRTDRTANAPTAVDAGFCYGGETNPCA